MAFIVIGVLIIAAHFAGFGPMAHWTWNLTGDLWKFCVPFALAAIWWAWADGSGLTKRREMDKMDQRRRERIAITHATFFTRRQRFGKTKPHTRR